MTQDEYDQQAIEIIDELCDGRDGKHSRTHEEIISEALRKLGQERDAAKAAHHLACRAVEIACQERDEWKNIANQHAEVSLALHGKLLVAVEALKYYADERNQVRVCPPPLRGWVPAELTAQEALLKIKGDKNAS